jgi:predicted transcriptional regulator
VDRVFQALAHTARREILDYVMANPGAQSNEISDRFEFTRVAVRKHIKVLEQCDLLIVEVSGRHRLHYFNPMPIQTIYKSWKTVYSGFL